MSCQSIVSAPQRTKWFNENGLVLKQIYKGPVPLLLFWQAVGGCGCVALSRCGSGFNSLASWEMVITKDTVKPGWFCNCQSELIFFILHFWLRQVLHHLIASFRRLTWHVFLGFFFPPGVTHSSCDDKWHLTPRKRDQYRHFYLLLKTVFTEAQTLGGGDSCAWSKFSLTIWPSECRLALSPGCAEFHFYWCLDSPSSSLCRSNTPPCPFMFMQLVLRRKSSGGAFFCTPKNRWPGP